MKIQKFWDILEFVLPTLSKGGENNEKVPSGYIVLIV